jgi:prepilin-type N-terminal cleavage/methylation domain-containing protein
MAVLNTQRGERGRDEAGFSLIEMSVVLVVISVLVAVAIVTLFGATDTTKDTAAQAKASTALKAHLATTADNIVYADEAQASALISSADSSIEVQPFDETAVNAENVGAQVKGRVYVKLDSGDVVLLVSKSVTGRCFWTRDVNGHTSYAVTNCPDLPTEFDSRW